MVTRNDSILHHNCIGCLFVKQRVKCVHNVISCSATLLLTTMNNKPTRCTIVLKSLKFYCILSPHYMFRAFLAHHREPPNSAPTASSHRVSLGSDKQSWKIQPTQWHTVTGGCMCRIRRLLMMGAREPETCRAEQEYNKFLMYLRLLCIWLVFYSLWLSLMHGTVNLITATNLRLKQHCYRDRHIIYEFSLLLQNLQLNLYIILYCINLFYFPLPNVMSHKSRPNYVDVACRI
jgi:tellurite resistance protein TehA-like permease